MLIGIIDQDALLHGLRRPNLELMKYSSYHKNKNDIVEFITDMREISKYSIVYLRKEKSDKHIPTQTLAKPNVQWGGAAFTGIGYIPLPPEIEYQKADFTLYNGFLSQQFLKGKITQEQIRDYTNCNYIRFIHNQELLNPKYKKQLDSEKRRIQVYDDDFFSYAHCFKLLDSLDNHSVQFVRPHCIDTVEELTKVIEYNQKSIITSHSNLFILNFPFNGYEYAKNIFPLIKGKEYLFPLCISTIPNHITVTKESNMMKNLFEILDIAFFGNSRGYNIRVAGYFTNNNMEYTPLFHELQNYFMYGTQQTILSYVSEGNRGLLLKYVPIMGTHTMKLLTTPLSQVKKEVWPLGYTR